MKNTSYDTPIHLCCDHTECKGQVQTKRGNNFHHLDKKNCTLISNKLHKRQHLLRLKRRNMGLCEREGEEEAWLPPDDVLWCVVSLEEASSPMWAVAMRLVLIRVRVEVSPAADTWAALPSAYNCKQRNSGVTTMRSTWASSSGKLISFNCVICINQCSILSQR